MKVAVVLIVLAILGAIWFLFFTNKPLKSSEQIDKMVIFYNEKQEPYSSYNCENY